MSKRAVTITEHGAIGCGKTPVSDKFLCDEADAKTFEALKRFNADYDDAIFTLTRCKTEDGSKVDALKAQSYVGVIETKCGTVVEILPKIYPGTSEEEKNNTRKIFLNMLRCLRDSPFKEIDDAHLHTVKHSLLEIFITLFLKDLEKLIQKGIAKDYVNVEENQPFLKGKLLFNQNIKYNFLHKERFYVSFDEFISNRPENRLIKSTLQLLAKKARSTNNQKRLREFIFTFDEVPESCDIDADLSKIKQNRLITHYEKTLRWCRVFLRNESFTHFKGKTVSLALLFQMERIFEDFVGIMFKRVNNNPELNVLLQKSEQYLIEEHNGRRMFKLRPDITARDHKTDKKTVILDTKWKLIDQDKSKDNYNISQGDFYQMFAYGKKYEADELYLLYPQSESFNKSLKCFSFYKDENEDKNMKLYVCPVPLHLLSEKKEDNKEEFKSYLKLDKLRNDSGTRTSI